MTSIPSKCSKVAKTSIVCRIPASLTTTDLVMRIVIAGRVNCSRKCISVLLGGGDKYEGNLRASIVMKECDELHTKLTKA